MCNMRYRHRVNPPKYVLEAEQIRQQMQALEDSCQRRLKLLQEHLKVLEAWVPDAAKPATTPANEIDKEKASLTYPPYIPPHKKNSAHSEWPILESAGQAPLPGSGGPWDYVRPPPARR